MFESQTQETIRDRMLDNLSNEIDKREGSIAQDLLTPKSIELAQVYLELDNVLKFGFAETSYGEYLDRRVAEVGLTRLNASVAYTTVRLNGPVGTFIPVRTAIYNDVNIRFLTTQEATIGNEGYVVINAESEVPGFENNIPANSLNSIDIDEVTVVSNTVAIGGEDIESDEKLYARYKIQVARASNSGSEDNYKQWALNHASVGFVSVDEIFYGPGTVRLIILGNSKEILPQEIITEVSNYIENVRPIGADVYVETGAALPVNIAADVTLVDGQTLESAADSIKLALNAYLKSITLVEDEIKISKIITTMMSTGVISDYSNLSVNNDLVNIPLHGGLVPHIENVVIQ